MGLFSDSINALASLLPQSEKTISILNAQPDAPDNGGFITVFNGETIPFKSRETAADKLPTTEKLLSNLDGGGIGGSSVTVIDLGRGKTSSVLERKPDVRLLRAFSKSVWVRAAIDYYRRTAGRAKFELVPIETTAKPTRRDKTVRADVDQLLTKPNVSGDVYGAIKEQMIEDYLVIGHGALRLDLRRDLTVSGIRIFDAANLGFLKDWDGADGEMPRYCEFDEKNPSRVKRYFASEEIMCLVNRPCSYSMLGFSHVEVLYLTVTALLNGDEFLLKQIVNPVAESLIDLGEGATKTQVEDFKFQIQQVKDKLAVIGGTKNTRVHRLAGTAEEMKILDGAQWFVRQVAAIFGISTAKLKLAVDTSRANTEAMYDDDLEAITGELVRFEELETATFINRYGYQGEINLKFFYPIMHRKDEKQQAVIARTQTGQPWASVNEARYRTGEELLDENDYPFANQPVVNTKEGPVPMTIWTKQMQELEKNIVGTPLSD